MNFKTQIQECSTRIKLLEDQAAELHVESYELRRKREELIATMIVEDKLMVNTEWDLVLNDSFNIRLDYKETGVSSMEFIKELARTDYYSWFDLSDGIQLRFDDSNISLSFREAKQVMPFIKKNGLIASGNDVTDRLAKLKRNVSALETICHQFNLDKK
jgi:hypothetical protein